MNSIAEQRLFDSAHANRVVHFKLLNTLSLLEHLGSRKIMLSSGPPSALTSEIIRHLAEETRHALFFKTAAERIAGRTLGYNRDEILGGPSALSYINRIDILAGRHLERQNRYLGASLAIELRALVFYQSYEQAAIPSAPSLRAILTEEQRHAAEFRAAIESDGLSRELDLLTNMESEAYARLTHALAEAAQANCGSPSAAAI